MEYKKEIIENTKLGEKYIRIKHPSGCTVCLYPMEKYSSTYALFGTRYGSVDTCFKTDENEDFVSVPEGIAHYLEHKLFESDECSVFSEFAKTGANANAYTSFDRTVYLFSCTQKFEENLEILLDFVQKPYFTDENVEKERGIIAQEIDMYQDDPGWRVFFNCLQAVYYNNPIRIDIAGSAESIAKINKELLYRCYDTFYNLNNMILSIAGSFDTEKVLEICDKCLKPSKNHKLEKIIPDEPYEVKEKTVTVKLPCAHPLFNIMYKFPQMTSKEAQTAYITYTVMLETCLGCTSSFYTNMYEQGLINESFNVGVFYCRGAFVCVIDGESKEPFLLKEKINSELNRLRTELPKRDEFENIKKRVYGGFLYYFENVSSNATSMLNAEMLGVNVFDGVDIISKLTYEDILDALNKLDIDNCSISVVEPTI